jgi:hypothetical protein
MPRPSFLTSMYTRHMGSRWHTPDFYSHSRHLIISLTVTHPDVEVKGFNYLCEGNDSLLHVSICCKSLVIQGLIKRPPPPKK